MLNLFKKKWVIFSSIGVLALSLLIWFAGPYLIVALGDSLNRWLTILPLWIVWLAIILWLYFRERKKSKAMVESIASPADEEIASLKNRFEDALQALRQAGGKKRYGNQYLYELPWYIIIGPPGSGKTTILRNSELKFPLSDEFGPDAIRGVGGTRDCDWWFTDEAILLDTAGRYTTQDSDESVDKQTWQGFLGLLKKYRKRRPVNGILIVLSITDLMDPDESKRHVRAIRKRLQELDQYLKIRFPIYVLFTKCDLMAGFMEFFDRLTPNERGQVWGMTFPTEEKDVVKRFPEEFDLLMSRLNTQHLQRVSEERNMHRRVLVYNLPPQIISLKEALNEFLQDLFRPNRFQPAPFLRGVYFSSGTQEGSPIDRIMGATVRSFGLDQQVLAEHSGSGRSYFINRLFKKVIFPESDIVGLDLRFEKQRLWLQRAAIGGAVGITILSVYAWWNSYDHNKTHVDKMDNYVETYCIEREESCKGKTKKLEKADFKGILPALDSLQKADQIYPTLLRENEDSVPVSMRLGLYQGYQLNPSAHDAYYRVLNKVFLRHIAVYLYNQLAEQLKAGVTDDSEGFLYQNLKVYLMLTEEYVKKLDPALLQVWMSDEWEKALDINSNEQERLQAHLKALLQGDIIPLKQSELEDTALVDNSRKILLSKERSLQLYWQVKEEAEGVKLPPFRVSSELGEPVTRVFASQRGGDILALEIPGLFTYEGYCGFFNKEIKRVVKDSLEENWVLGLKEQGVMNKEQSKKLTRDIQELYFDEYIKQWKELVYLFKIIPLSDIDTTVRMLDTGSIPNSPMRRLLQKLGQNTMLVCESKTDTALADAGGVDSALRVGQALGSSTASSLLNRKRRLEAAKAKGKKEKDPALMVAEVFEPLFKLVQGENYRAEEFHQILEQLGKVRDLLNQPQTDLSWTKRNDAIGDLERIADTMALHQPVKDWIDYIIDRSKSLVNHVVDDRETAAAREQARQEAEAEREQARQEAEAAAKAATEKAEAEEKARQDKITEMNAQWRSKVLAEYNKLRDFYPLSQDGKDMPLPIFAKFFGPGGTLEQFFEEHLGTYINKAIWRFSDNPLGLSRDILKSFREAEAIQDAFFISGSEPSVSFYLRSEDLQGTDVNQFRLLLGDQEFSYAYGPIQENKLEWPANGAKIQFMTSGGSRVALQEYGEWAWFRILDEDVMPTGTQLIFTTGDAIMQCKMRVDSLVNPFHLVHSKVLSSFDLPLQLN
ncbi:MAG: type VI secretion system membrane subunit TssM [Pseudomonadota bacterium]